MDTRLFTSAAGLLLLAATILPATLAHGLGSFSGGVSGVYIGRPGVVDGHLGPTISVDAMLCDLEVVVDSAGFPLNEEDVDGNNGLAPNTVDDGGFGGACHVATYQTADYNTNGCLSGMFAHGQDFVSPLDIWIGASCDYQTVGGIQSFPVLAHCVAFEVVRQTDPTALQPCVDAFVDCTLMGCTVSCGSDGFVDGIHYGHGSSGAGHQARFPANPCPPGPATSAIHVFNAVVLQADGGLHPHPAISGEVWTDF